MCADNFEAAAAATADALRAVHEDIAALDGRVEAIIATLSPLTCAHKCRHTRVSDGTWCCSDCGATMDYTLKRCEYCNYLPNEVLYSWGGWRVRDYQPGCPRVEHSTGACTSVVEAVNKWNKMAVKEIARG